MDFLSAHAARQPDHPAVRVDDQAITYGELEERANRLAHAMLALGLEHHDKVTTVGYNSPEHLVISSASRKVVTVGLRLNYRLRSGEIEYQLNHSDTAIIFSGPEHVDAIRSVEERCPKLRHRVAWGCEEMPEGWQRFDELVESGSPEPPAIEAGLVGPTMTYTAGTTGNPKGAYRAEGADPVVIQSYVRWFDLRPTDRHLVAGPLYHSAPAAFALLNIILGATNILMRRFDAEECLALIERHGCTTTFMAPTLLQRIVALPDEVRRRYDLSSMRTLVVAAAPCPFELKRKVMDLFGEVLYEFYGSSEVGVNTVMRPEEQLRKPGSCGQVAVDVDIKIVDEEGNECPPGVPGELYIKGPSLITGYYRNDRATKQARRGEYFTVGDVGYLDDDRYLYIVDRKRDQIISGGVNICSAEIENVIHAHPKVWDVAVIGIPSDEWGESVHAIVQPQPGEGLKEAEIIGWVEANLASYKKPRSVEFRTELPRDEAGKIRKRDLREPFWRGRKRRV